MVVSGDGAVEDANRGSVWGFWQQQPRLKRQLLPAPAPAPAPADGSRAEKLGMPESGSLRESPMHVSARQVSVNAGGCSKKE